VLVETGVVGLLVFAWLMIVLLRNGMAVLRSRGDPTERGLVLGFVAGFVGLLTHAIGANTFIIVRVMEPFWFFAGVVMMLPVLQPEGSAAAVAPPVARAVPPGLGPAPPPA